MEISKSIKRRLCLFLFAIYSVSLYPLSILATSSPAMPEFNLEDLDPQMQIQFQEQLKKVQEEYLEEKIKPILKAYEQIDFICEHLAQVINNHQVRNAQEKEAITYIKNLRQTIQEIKKGSYIVLDPYSVKALLALAEHIIKLLRTIVKNGLKEFPSPELENVIKRSLDEETFDFEHIEQQCADLEHKVKTLDKESQSVGLSLFNKGYRSLEKLCTDHHIISRTGFVLLLGLGAYVLISRILPPIDTKPGNQETSFWDKLKKFVGQAPTYLDGTCINEKELGTLTKREAYLRRLGILNLTLPSLITWELLIKPFKNSFQEIGTWAQKQWDKLRSVLRGGPAEKRTESWKKEPKVRFNQIIGKEHHKHVLGRVVDYIRDHERYDRAGIAPEAGYLLAGPTRTGKTYLAEALAGEVKDALAEKGINNDHNFLEFNAADVKLWGISTIMMLAQENAPCILFIDEIDMCGWQRERDAEGLSQVLTAMSGCMNKDRSKTVIVIGATNKPENLDQALLQKGRFGKILWFDYPTVEDRISFLRRELENRSIMSIDDTYLQKLAHETDRCSFDDLSSIVVTALQKSKSSGEVLTEKHLEEAFDEEIRHVLYEDVPLTEPQKRVLAVHQSGHALATLLLDETPHITKVTIRPINTKIAEESVYAKYSFYDGKTKDDNLKKAVPIEYGKLFSSRPQHADTINTHQELINKCRIELAGHVAEKIILGSSSFTYHRDDKEKALHIAQYIVFEGMKHYDLPKKLREELEEKAYALMQECEQHVYALLNHRKDKLDALALALQEKQTLSSVEIVEILELDEDTGKIENNTHPLTA
jgi:cell division protease FtsH